MDAMLSYALSRSAATDRPTKRAGLGDGTGTGECNSDGIRGREPKMTGWAMWTGMVHVKGPGTYIGGGGFKRASCSWWAAADADRRARMATSSLADRLATADAVLSLGMSPGASGGIGTIGRALYARYVAVMGYVHALDA